MPISTPTQITVPFATSGLKNAIPAAANPVTGNAGYDAGFPATNMTPKEAGGIPPFGQDFNGILFDITTAIQYLEAGMQFPYSSAFATAVGGYPQGAIVTRTDGSGFWRNTVANNTTNPETFGAGWAPEGAGISTVAMSNANITLTALQAARPIIIITGALTANLQLIFPTYQRQWLVVNNATGAFSVTCKTASGSGASVGTSSSSQIFCDGASIFSSVAQATQQQSRIQSLTATASANAILVSMPPTSMDFRSANLADGTSTSLTSTSSANITIPSGATLGTANGVQSKIAILAMNNSGVIELAVTNMAGGNNLDETSLISTIAISSGSSLSTGIYSTSARTNVPFRVVGYFTSTQPTAGAWSVQPSLVQGAGGVSVSSMASAGYAQAYQNVTASRASGVTYNNTTGRPIFICVSVSIGSSATFSFSIDGAVRISGSNGGAGTATFPVSILVPPNSTYSMTFSGTLVNWSELR